MKSRNVYSFLLYLQCLIITKRFVPQILPLEATDFAFWHWTIDSTNAVGFYNSNHIAGASQRHRHMQFLPSDSLWHYRRPDDVYVRRDMWFDCLLSFCSRKIICLFLLCILPHFFSQAFPLEDLIMPSIEAGQWRVYFPSTLRDQRG
jgi:hypothetical protein